jgi:hypothetical protein
LRSGDTEHEAGGVGGLAVCERPSSVWLAVEEPRRSELVKEAAPWALHEPGPTAEPLARLLHDPAGGVLWMRDDLTLSTVDASLNISRGQIWYKEVADKRNSNPFPSTRSFLPALDLCSNSNDPWRRSVIG